MAKPIIEYKLITWEAFPETEPEKLNEQVTTLLEQGWELYGSPMVTRTEARELRMCRTFIVQAMTRST